MTEAIGGTIGLAGLEIKEGFVLFRYFKERRELMKIVGNEKQSSKIVGKLQCDEHKGDLVHFVKHEEDGLKKGISIMNMFADLINHLMFDIHNTKSVLEKIHEIDLTASKQGFPKERIAHLDAEVQQEIHQMNATLRNISYKMGALIRD